MLGWRKSPGGLPGEGSSEQRPEAELGQRKGEKNGRKARKREKARAKATWFKPVSLNLLAI